MEEKTYEAGRVEISSAEYRDLIKEAVESSIAASDARSARWEAEKELEGAREEIAQLKKELDNMRSMLAAPLEYNKIKEYNDYFQKYSDRLCSNTTDTNKKENK